jgi:hypothetical protein
MEVMTGNNRKERNALNRLADLFAEDILNTSDEEILAEFKERHGNPVQNAAAMRALFEKTVIAANKSRLNAARLAVAASRRSGGALTAIDIAEARQKLRRILATGSPGQSLTLAARKEDELSDADVLGMLEDLSELGALPPDEPTGRL